MSNFKLEDLVAIIRARRDSDGETSYTRKLLDGGVALCAKKLGEEATETIIAALEGKGDNLRNEAADLLYHLLVLLEAGEVGFDEVLDELERRTSISGLEEKSARTTD